MLCSAQFISVSELNPKAAAENELIFHRLEHFDKKTVQHQCRVYQVNFDYSLELVHQDITAF